MILPRKPVPGEPVSAQLIGRMIDYMRRITPIAGVRTRVASTPGGSIISALPADVAAQAQGTFPFEVRAVQVSGAGGTPQTVLAIYTPAGVLCVDDAVVGTIATATALASQGDGWYTYTGVVPPSAGQSAQIWLTVTWPTGTGAVSGSPTAAISLGAGSGESVLLARVARSSAGVLTIFQCVYSALGFWRPVKETTPDDVSIGFVPAAAQGQQADPDEGKLQVNGWKAGTPQSQTTLAADMSATGASGHVVFRNASGTLEYKPIGQLQGGGGGGGGLTGTVEFVADVDWYVNGSVHQLRKRLRILDLSTGQVTDKANTTYANGWEVMANSTPITSIVNNS